MKIPMLVLTVAALSVAGWADKPTEAKPTGGNVKITALGTHTGEVCRRDRAILFEDPKGATLLFDAGRSRADVTRVLEISYPAANNRWKDWKSARATRQK